MKTLSKFLITVGIFLGVYYLPVEKIPVGGAMFEALALLKWYAREHVLLCLVPAFFIAGGISVFIRQQAVMKYFGAGAKKVLAYAVASISGTILAVCSCTVLPLFSGIYKKGAGLGPATSFLYSGPAINILAIILTARVLGWQLGIARALGAVSFSVIIGLCMHYLFIKEEKERKAQGDFAFGEIKQYRPLWKEATYFASMAGILVFANWARPAQDQSGMWAFIFENKWYITGMLGIGLLYMITRWFETDEIKEWISATWAFALQILPLLFAGVLVSGFLFGSPGHEGLIPARSVETLVGGNSFLANLFASVVGAFMYFATLTEVPILQGLIGAGMGKGPALALLLAGPALSLPSMLVIRSILGTKKTLIYVGLVVVMATISGMIFGFLTG